MDFVPDSDPLAPSGWHAFQHHYSAETIEGSWVKSPGLAFNHSTDPNAWDYAGQFSPSVIFDPVDKRWFAFYSATAKNYSEGSDTCAQLVRTSRSPDGPWGPIGAAATPKGTPGKDWGSLRLDSGRALVIGGKKGWWTKGCSGGHVHGKSVPGSCSEGLYVPKDASSFAPPYRKVAGPVWDPDSVCKPGFENCEFWRHGGLLHIVCAWHESPSCPKQPDPHFVVDLEKHPEGHPWTYVRSLNWTLPLHTPGEPTPVYEGVPGDAANVSYFIARIDDLPHNSTSGKPQLGIGLYKLAWLKADDDAAPVETMQAGSTFLLLDERNIIASHNVQLKLGSVTKHPSNPLLREEKP